jgi:hypothetical protein
MRPERGQKGILSVDCNPFPTTVPQKEKQRPFERRLSVFAATAVISPWRRATPSSHYADLHVH